jgi:hypothetical protein
MSDDARPRLAYNVPSKLKGAFRTAVRLTPHILAAAVFMLAATAPAFCQTADGGAAGAVAEAEAPPRVFLVLTGGGKVQVDEVSEKSDGWWYRRGNVWAVLDRENVARVEREEPAKKADPVAPPKVEPARWSLTDAARVELFFMKKFGRQLPITAYGQSGLHTRWGYNHRRSMDVGLHPDSAEGKALIAFLSAEGIPFLGFRTAIPGVASAPHIHVGFPSRRLTAR